MAEPASELLLLTKRRFAPLFVTNLLGVVNDNLFKTGLLVMASYGVYRADPGGAALLASVATGVFIAPFFLFSALAGQIADAWERSRLVRWVKVAEVGIMALGLAGFLAQSIPLLLCALFLMGVHSTVYGPLKYAILPQHLGQDEILGGTGVMEAGGFVAILGGQLLAGLVAPWQAGLVACVLACLGLTASLLIPAAPPGESGGRIELNVPVVSWRLVRMAQAIRPVWLSVLGIAWFFAVGAVLLSELIPLVQGVLHGRQAVAALFLAIFSLGIAAGSLAVNRLLRGEVSARYAPVSALALAALLLDLSFAVGHVHAGGGSLGVVGFVTLPGAWRILLDLGGLAVAGGVFVIPLYAILQTDSPPQERSRILAGNNIVNAAITVAAVIAAAILLKLGVGIGGLIALLGIATLGVAIAAGVLLPEASLKPLLWLILKALYRVEITGLANMPKPGEGAVLVVNHVSYLDALLLAVFLPGRPSFAIHTQIREAWWMKPLLPLVNTFPVDVTSASSTKAMIRAVREGRTLVVFPEGRMTQTGALMKVFGGPGVVADRAGAPVVPMRIDGPQYTRFSHLQGKVRMRRFPKVRLTLLPPHRLQLDGDLSPRQRHARIADQLYDVMSEMMFATTDIERTLFQALLHAQAVHGHKAEVVEDAERRPMSYARLITGARAMARALEPLARSSGAVGLMLPNSCAAATAFFALQAGRRTAAMLDPRANVANLLAACAVAEVRTVITSRSFVAKAGLQALTAAFEDAGLRILWLEELESATTGGRSPPEIASSAQGPHEPAVILFNFAPGGAVTGVVLTHRNLLANCAQIAARVDFNPTDTLLNALPIHQGFGLTVGLLLPVLNGVKTLLHPDPSQFAAIVALAYDASATILLGAETLLAGCGTAAQDYDFYSLRHVFALAPIEPETRARYAQAFGLRILEAYGDDECGPVIAMNTAMRFSAGSVGQLLPGIEARIDPQAGVKTAGRLRVQGPNLMAGRYLADRPGVLRAPPTDGWETDDILSMDERGFLYLHDGGGRPAEPRQTD